jgi:hypothetical protein
MRRDVAATHGDELRAEYRLGARTAYSSIVDEKKRPWKVGFVRRISAESRFKDTHRR